MSSDIKCFYSSYTQNTKLSKCDTLWLCNTFFPAEIYSSTSRLLLFFCLLSNIFDELMNLFTNVISSLDCFCCACLYLTHCWQCAKWFIKLCMATFLFFSVCFPLFWPWQSKRCMHLKMTCLQRIQFVDQCFGFGPRNGSFYAWSIVWFRHRCSIKTMHWNEAKYYYLSLYSKCNEHFQMNKRNTIENLEEKKHTEHLRILGGKRLILRKSCAFIFSMVIDYLHKCCSSGCIDKKISKKCITWHKTLQTITEYCLKFCGWILLNWYLFSYFSVLSHAHIRLLSSLDFVFTFMFVLMYLNVR